MFALRSLISIMSAVCELRNLCSMLMWQLEIVFKEIFFMNNLNIFIISIVSIRVDSV